MHPVRCARRQEEGELEKWSSKNEFQVKDLWDGPDFIQDVKDETAWIHDWKKDGEGGKENDEETKKDD